MGCVAPPPRVFTCPVCGARVLETTTLKLVHNGRVYYFDKPECLEEFAKNPEKYAP